MLYKPNARIYCNQKNKAKEETMNKAKEFSRREAVAKKLSKISGAQVEAVHPNGPSGFKYVVDGRLCRDYRDAMRVATAN